MKEKIKNLEDLLKTIELADKIRRGETVAWAKQNYLSRRATVHRTQLI